MNEPEPKAMTLDDLMLMLATCDDSLLGRRNQAILFFFADTGCRAGGLIGLTDERLHLDARRAIVIEKGNKTRPVYLTQPTVMAVQLWLEVRPTQAVTVFCSLQPHYYGHALTIEGLYAIMHRMAVLAGVQGKYNPHSLRHMFAMLNLENGNDLLTVSQLLGHTDISTTTRYLLFTDKQRAARHDQFSPINVLTERLMLNG